MVKTLALMMFALPLIAQTQVSQPQPTCRPAAGVYLPPPPLGAECVALADPPPVGAPNIHAAWTMAGLRFPHPNSGDKVCMVYMGYTPDGWVSTWTPNISMVGYRENGSSDSDQVNFTAVSSYLAADTAQDIRAPRWGARKSSDDIPNGATLMALFEPYVMTIHDIPNPSGLGSGNTAGKNRTVTFTVCREDGPAHTSPFTDNGLDVNDGAIVIVQANLRWEDAADARMAVYPMPLASVEQVDPVQRVLPSGINGAFLGFAENLYQMLNIYVQVPLWFPVDGAVIGACAEDTPGEWPTCNPAHRLNTIVLHDDETEYMYLATEVPGDYVAGSEVRLDAEFFPGADTGDYYFFVQTYFSSIGANVTIAPSEYSEEVVTTVSCYTGVRQQASFPIIDMTGANPGDKMFIRVGRRGADALDTATADASMTGLRLWFKRKVQIEAAVAAQ